MNFKAYPDEELKNCANVLYQHIFTNYRVYKRDLTESEVRTNFEALRGRFGL